MSSSFDTVQRALLIVRDASNLTERQKDLISFSQEVIDEWHDENHKLNDQLNKSERVAETIYYLDIIIREKDKQKQVELMMQWEKIIILDLIHGQIEQACLIHERLMVR